MSVDSMTDVAVFDSSSPLLEAVGFHWSSVEEFELFSWSLDFEWLVVVRESDFVGR